MNKLNIQEFLSIGRIILLAILVICSSKSFGQEIIIRPHVGIEGVPVVLDSTNLDEVVEYFGTEYEVIKKRMCIYYKYDKIGLTFQIRPYDKNQLIRSITLEAPFNGKTIEGIELGKSTMKEVWNIYNVKRCGTSSTDAYVSKNGIRYYFKKYSKKRPKRYLNEKVYKIRIHNDGKYGTISKVNYEFNQSPVDSVSDKLYSILTNPDFNLKQLNTFLEKAKKTENDYYGLKKSIVITRKIGHNLIQEYSELKIVSKRYKLNIIKKDDQLVFLRLSNGKTDSTIVEQKPNKDYQNSDFSFYIFGNFCGFVGGPPVKCLDMISLVNSNDYNSLTQWLNSINPEKASYGYTGLYFLSKKGIKISASEYKRMNEILKSKIKLYTCEGCYFGTIKTSGEILNEEHLFESYNNFNQLDYIK